MKCFKFLLFGLVIALLPLHVHAEDLKLEFAPTKLDVKLERGATYVQRYRVGNFSQSKKVLYVVAQDFTITSEDGFPSFIEKTADTNKKYSLVNWLALPKTPLEINSGQTKEFDVSITVPKDAETGGHYAAVFIQSKNPEDPKTSDVNSIDTVARISSLILLNVPGDIIEKLTLDKFFTSKKIYLDDRPDVTFEAVVKNEGNVHQVPSGYLFLTGGGFKSKTIPFNVKQLTILPDSPNRKITETFKLSTPGFIPPMGRFDVSLVARYGASSTNLQLQGSTYFWVIPVRFLLVSLGIALLGFFVIWRVVVSFRRTSLYD